MKRFLVLAAVLLVALLIAGGIYVGRRNQMAAKSQAVTAQWAQTDLILRRRADLIPSLVEAVKDVAGQEQTVLGDIAKARSAFLSAQTPADRIAANRQLDGVLGRLLAIAESYPRLKSNEKFLRLQDELAGSENRVAVEGRRYNEAVQDYNTYIGLFPNNIVAGWAGFKPNSAYFTEAQVLPQTQK